MLLSFQYSRDFLTQLMVWARENGQLVSGVTAKDPSCE